MTDPTVVIQKDIAGNKTTADQLKAYIERVERLESEKKEMSQDISEIFKEASGNGFNVKVMKKIIAMRKIDPAEQEELDSLIETYKVALGMI